MRFDNSVEYLEYLFSHLELGDKPHTMMTEYIVNKGLTYPFACLVIETFRNKWEHEWKNQKTFDVLKRLNQEIKRSPHHNLEEMMKIYHMST